MAEDYELPVWGVRPNWSQSIIETLTWLTDVLQSQSAAEQRIARRLAPRRTFEARYNPYEHERTVVDLFMHKLARTEWMMPLWFDRSDLTATAVAGSSRLDLPTQYREFVAGGMAYLVGPDAFTGEAVRIDAVDATGLDLAVPLDKEWAAGTTIHPMRRGHFESAGQNLLTSRLGETNLRFEVIEDNEIADEGAWDVLHSDGRPVLTREPEWSQPIEIDLSWLGGEFDPQVGKKRVTDTAGRSFRQQRHAFILAGAAERFEYRQMLYRLRGQQKPVWLPTFADDIEIAVDALAGAASIDVAQMGLTYIGGPTDGRDRLYFGDGEIAQISSSAIIAEQRERLDLAAPLAVGRVAGERASFIELSRLAQDSVEIEHIGDTDGVARSTLSFTAISDRRNATPAPHPIPAGVMNSEVCGQPADEVASECTNFVVPPVYTHNGWSIEFRWEVEDSLYGGNTTSMSGWNHPGLTGSGDNGWSVEAGAGELVNPDGAGAFEIPNGASRFVGARVADSDPNADRSGDWRCRMDPDFYPGREMRFVLYYRKWNGPLEQAFDSGWITSATPFDVIVSIP